MSESHDPPAGKPILDYGTGAEHRMHRVAVFPSESEAHLAASFLAGHEIEAQVAPSGKLHGMGDRSAALFVDPDDAPDAAQLLMSTPAARFLDAMPPPVLSYATPVLEMGAWATVWSAASPQEAALAVGWLMEQGINARVDAANTATLGAWAGAGPGTSTGVQVVGADVGKAKQRLAELEATRARRRFEDVPRCPTCGEPAAKRVIPRVRWVGVALIIVAVATQSLNAGICFPVGILGVLFLVWQVTPRWKCANGHRWRAPIPEPPDDEDDSV